MSGPLLDHVSLGTGDLVKARRFYDPVLATLGCAPLVVDEQAIGYGRTHPVFWIVVPLDDTPAIAGSGTHVAFAASDEAQVRAFHHAALAAGGTDAGAPGPRPAYGPGYFGCFIRDPDGHKIEAVFREDAMPD